MSRVHDPLCPPFNGHLAADRCEVCELLTRVRADERERIVQEGWVNPDAYRANVKILREQERERIAQAIEMACDFTDQWPYYDAAARIARGKDGT